MTLAFRFGLLLFALTCSTHVLPADFFNQPEVRGYNFDSRIRTPLQDDDGFIWFSSKNSIWRYDGYKVVNINEIYQTEQANLVQTRFFYQDQAGAYWIGTNNGHLYKLTNNIREIQVDSDVGKATPRSYAAITENTTGIWVATLNELITVQDNQASHFPYPANFANSLINSVVAHGPFIYVVTSTQLLRFSIAHKTFDQVIFIAEEDPPNLRSLTVVGDTFWLSTDRGVYSKTTDSNTWQRYLPDVLDMRIRCVTEDKNHIWVATILNGLYRISKNNGDVTHFNHDPDDPSSIASDELTDIMIDDAGLVWLFHFGGMVNYLDLNQFTTGLNQEFIGTDCYQQQVIYAFADDAKHIWYLMQHGILKLEKSAGQCQLINTFINQAAAFNNRVPFSIAQDNDSNHWIGTSNGILKLTPENELILSFPNIDNVSRITYIGNHRLIAATDDGVYLIDVQTQETNNLTNDVRFKNIKFNDIMVTASDTFFFASSDGLYYTKDILQEKIKKMSLPINPGWINSLLSSNDYFWLATQSSGLIILDRYFELTKQLPLTNDQNAPVSMHSLLEDLNQHVWMATNNGLYQLDKTLNILHHYTPSNGLQGLRFNMGAAHRSTDGKLFFGGRNGYNTFYPNQVKRNTSAPPVVLTRLSRFNKTVIPNNESEFQLPKNINDLSNLTLSHKDYVIGFEFSALSFAHADKNKYAYKLKGFEQSWNYVDADNRTATYTNLPRGTYDFQIMASNSDGIWNPDPKSLTVKVLPPPWLTWWALSSYVLLTLSAIYWYIHRKINADQKIAAILRVEVAEKTKELNIQKQTVESLLIKKNELFANVSHEFRTPLTLILGPIKTLLAKQVDPDNVNALKTVKRNANRLLSLVEQLLQLARVANFKEIKTTAQNTQRQISVLIQSFEHMAQGKNIQLQLLKNEQSNIDVTDQFIDVVLGNLISNAIKYTSSGGIVAVRAGADQGIFSLSVKDTGHGLTDKQKSDIFKRFKRLKPHQSIEGIGIGLAVVEEIVKINNGEIKVLSTLGEGSEFIVTLPISDAKVADEKATISSLVTQLRSEPVETYAPKSLSEPYNENTHLNTVLVIEDNHDMREHIVDIIEPHYNCLAADNGSKGVTIAVEHIPDLIISDVMMPEMDGFNVSRIIRSDERTSHIPLMLLTALNDKTSRIKGWREHVDAYMTKPFDHEELLVQVENMLTIRDILRNKASTELNSESAGTILSKTDQNFIDKVMDVIESDFKDPMLNRNKVAKKMAVSERQLQRKLKALINQNPSDLIREVRLKHAKRLLKDGYQVGLIADDCGFNSLSYFSQCFKAQYGMTPKKYQQQFNQ